MADRCRSLPPQNDRQLKLVNIIGGLFMLFHLSPVVQCPPVKMVTFIIIIIKFFVVVYCVNCVCSGLAKRISNKSRN